MEQLSAEVSVQQLTWPDLSIDPARAELVAEVAEQVSTALVNSLLWTAIRVAESIVELGKPPGAVEHVLTINGFESAWMTRAEIAYRLADTSGLSFLTSIEILYSVEREINQRLMESDSCRIGKIGIYHRHGENGFKIQLPPGSVVSDKKITANVNSIEITEYTEPS